MKILAVRFSALGDVAMLAPVLKKVLDGRDWLEIVFVTREHLTPLFEGIPRLTVIGINLKDEINSTSKFISWGIQLQRTHQFDVFVDLHGVLRTFILRASLRLMGVKWVSIDKERGKKKQYIKAKKELRRPLKHTSQRYLDAFRKAMITIDDRPIKPLSKKLKNENPSLLHDLFEKKQKQKQQIIIGIAPFAAHCTKEWWFDKMQELIHVLASAPNISVVFFGGGKREAEKVSTWIADTPNMITVIGELQGLDQELQVISSLDVMLAMDSGNGHLSSIYGVPTYTIWGATHPDFGFAPLFSNNSHWIQTTNDLDCQPCSVFGAKVCSRGDMACMKSISVQQVLDQLLSNFEA